MSFKNLFILSALSIAIIGCSEKPPESEARLKVEQKKIEPLVITTTNGQNLTIEKNKTGINIKDMQNKAVLLNFFASWCPPCKAEIPYLNNIQSKYKDKLEIIGVALENTNLAELNSFIEEHSIIYKITHGVNNYELAKSIGGVNTIPFMILYYPDGRYAYHYVGVVAEEMLEADIQKVLS